MPNGNAKQRREQRRKQEQLPLSGVNAEPERQNESQRGYSSYNQEESKFDMLEELRKVLTSAAGWTAIFTAVLCIFSGLLWYVSDQSNETARATQRAFLNFAGIGKGVTIIDPQTKLRTAQEILVNWLNSGNTPTKNGVGRGNLELWPSTLPSGFDFKDLPGGSNIAMALGPHEISGLRMNVPVQDFKSAREGQGKLFVWGWTVYDDIFWGDPPHLTEFCAELIQIAITPSKDITDPSSDLEWSVVRCDRNNCYDKDCKDYKSRITEARTQ